MFYYSDDLVVVGSWKWGELLLKGWELALVVQHGATALASGFNAFHFLSYPWHHKRRRWGAFTLVLVNLAFLAQSLYLGILPSLMGEGVEEVVRNLRVRFLTGLLPLVASLLILALVVAGQKGRRDNLKGRVG